MYMMHLPLNINLSHDFSRSIFVTEVLEKCLNVKASLVFNLICLLLIAPYFDTQYDFFFLNTFYPIHTKYSVYMSLVFSKSP